MTVRPQAGAGDSRAVVRTTQETPATMIHPAPRSCGTWVHSSATPRVGSPAPTSSPCSEWKTPLAVEKTPKWGAPARDRSEPTTAQLKTGSRRYSTSHEARMQPWATSCRRSKIARSEEHTSELQSQSNLVCRLLL